MVEDNTKMCSLKLCVDKKSHKVLFAEAPKEFVDFLFGLLSLPIGSIMYILGKDVMVGSCFNSTVYESVKDLCTTYLLPNFQNDKELILCPKPFPGKVGAGSYVKETTTYMLLDDLTVKPMNTLSIVDVMANKLKVEDVGSVVELVLNVSMEKEVPKIILASLESKTVLTDVFLNNNNKDEEKQEEEDRLEREVD